MGSVHSKEASLLKSPYVAAKHGMLNSVLSLSLSLSLSRLITTYLCWIGIMGFARAVAKEGGEFGIATHVVCPGFVLTPLVEKQIPEQAKVCASSAT
jgi:3-hydroxybutyrate dehydrogenase